MPNHDQIKSGTLRAICTHAGISREEFLIASAQSRVQMLSTITLEICQIRDSLF
jgi:hypothetical protein